MHLVISYWLHKDAMKRGGVHIGMHKSGTYCLIPCRPNVLLSKLGNYIIVLVLKLNICKLSEIIKEQFEMDKQMEYAFRGTKAEHIVSLLLPPPANFQKL